MECGAADGSSGDEVGYHSDIFLAQRKNKEGTKDTKLDVDDASLCVLCALFVSFVIKNCRCGNASRNSGSHVYTHF